MEKQKTIGELMEEMRLKAGAKEYGFKYCLRERQYVDRSRIPSSVRVILILFSKR